MNPPLPVVLIYKRTHTDDPDKKGIFGENGDCMGKIRGYNYDAVIGIGGKSPWKGCEGIAYKINWIGINPIKTKGPGGGPLVTFSKFCLFNDKGDLVKDFAPGLHDHMYGSVNRRYVTTVSLPENIVKEVMGILRLAQECPPSKGRASKTSTTKKCNR